MFCFIVLYLRLFWSCLECCSRIYELQLAGVPGLGRWFKISVNGLRWPCPVDEARVKMEKDFYVMDRHHLETIRKR